MIEKIFCLNNKDKKRKLLAQELLRCKEEGLRVFINSSSDMGFNYGLISDGKSMIVISYVEYSSTLFSPTFEYVPSRKCGTGCKILDDGYGYKHLNKSIFDECVQRGSALARNYGAKFYKGINQYFTDKWLAENYIEL